MVPILVHYLAKKRNIIRNVRINVNLIQFFQLHKFLHLIRESWFYSIKCSRISKAC